MKTSIVIPIYNEEQTLRTILDRTLALSIDKEIICVDDCSQDTSTVILQEYERKNKIRVLKNDTNRGKGYSVRKGIHHATGHIIAIQDADLEYNPQDLERLVITLIQKKLDVIFGSRFLGKNHFKKNLFYFGNKGLSFFASILYFTSLSDMHTCYKVIKKDVLEDLQLQSDGFDLDTEIVAKLIRKKGKIIEIPIDYISRDASEGKKIKKREGLISLWILLKYRFWND